LNLVDPQFGQHVLLITVRTSSGLMKFEKAIVTDDVSEINDKKAPALHV
jgi:hypothetical protein